MKFTKLIVAACLLTSTHAFSQKNESPDVTNVPKFTFLNPGFSYEARIGKLQTIYVQPFLNTSTYTTTSYNNSTVKFFFDPAIDAQYRYYYNGRTREDHGKRTEKNSMNYLAAAVELIYTKAPVLSSQAIQAERRPVTAIGALWGFQRNYESRFSLDLNVGLGYQTSKYKRAVNSEAVSTTRFTLLSQLNLGFWLGKRE